VLNSADYGVPQTRERLILRAVAGQERPVLPTPTHARADKIAPWLDTRLPWVGWLEAIADLVDALPESRFADWQLKRLPREIRESLMLSAVNADGTTLPRMSNDPAFTLQATAYKQMPRALLVSNLKHTVKDTVTVRTADAPSGTITSGYRPNWVDRIVILDQAVDCQDSRAASGRTVSPDAAPMFTLSASMEPRRPARAYLTQLQPNARGDWRAATEPAKTLSAGDAAHQHNLASAGRVVKLSPRCLARLQSFPDSYALPERAALACEGIGNAVPCLLAQRIMELAND